MFLYNNLTFFSKTGLNLNLDRKYYTVAQIKNGNTGFGAIINPITNPSGEIITVEILDPGKDYDTDNTYLKIVDTNKQTATIPNNYINFGPDGEIENIDSTAFIDLNLTGFSFPSFTVSGNLYFTERISEHLIENEHIFILEKTKSNNKTKYTFPLGETNSKIKFKLKEENEYDNESIFLFDLKNMQSNFPEIVKTDIQTTELSNINGTIENGIRKNVTINPQAVQFNIGLGAKEEGIYQRTLEIFYMVDDTEYKLGEILLQGEVEGEDPRFKTLLTNLGVEINDEHEYIFRTSDINEEKIDKKLLNRKRKEFILEHSNIISYIGAYKGLFNILNWFGYDDLLIREYWKNINPDDEDFEEEIPFDINQRRYSKKLPAPSKLWKKTSKFSLVFQINRNSGEVDKWRMPITEDVFPFTIEEVIIKLYSLKRYLKEKYLPLNARIFEIVGEGIYYDVLKTESWNNEDKINNISYIRDFDFYADKQIVKIKDLRI